MVSLYNRSVLLNSSPCLRKFGICCLVVVAKKWRRKPQSCVLDRKLSKISPTRGLSSGWPDPWGLSSRREVKREVHERSGEERTTKFSMLHGNRAFQAP